MRPKFRLASKLKTGDKQHIFSILSSVYSSLILMILADLPDASKKQQKGGQISRAPIHSLLNGLANLPEASSSG
jgi:hypothetical protein